MDSNKKWDTETSKQVLITFLNKYNLNQKFSLVRFGENAVYKLENDPLIIRVHRPGKALKQIQNEVLFSRYLFENDFPSTHASLKFKEQPLQSEGYYITIWEWVPHDNKAEINWYDYGKLLNHFHIIASNYDRQLPLFDPFKKFNNRLKKLQENKVINQEYSNSLIKWAERLEEYSYQNIRCKENSVLHGDAHTGNVLVNRSKLILLDFENVSKGPPEWDLIPVAIALKRFDLPDESYSEFCNGYGKDIREWKHYDFAMKLREFSMTLWLFQNIEMGPEYKMEIDVRMKTWLGDGNDDSKWRKF